MERRYKVLVCRGPECGERRDSRAVFAALSAAVEAAGLGGRCSLDWQSCFGRCSQGPNVLVRELVAEGDGAGAGTRSLIGLATLPGPRGATALYNRMDPSKTERVVEAHVGRGLICRELIERPTLLPSKLPTPETPES
ncbi:MAG: (2Fe-2S) ferredoxin domain-containing protein [Kofleriaceae bacterium]|nr:(2Fe-2S) ferredoxin domain-containing protein [Kofleriaceae bacterium]MBP9205466.1 (2Fe-2S) ferredoxin domain-containing protein [Kofleriaceae bacterium]